MTAATDSVVSIDLFSIDLDPIGAVEAVSA